MGILFSAVAEAPYAHAWHDWARLALSTLGTMIALRNLLVSMYEASVCMCGRDYVSMYRWTRSCTWI